jgi:Fic family protein
MWRLNWIHPFAGGNGRTSRAVSYLVLCAKLGYRIPGTKTIPDQIVDCRAPYYEALDAALEKGSIDVRGMEALLTNMLAVQLSSILKKATLNG